MQAVAYIRVSTRRQADSGLGLEAQIAAVQAFCKSRGVKVVATFREIESGRKADRPELAKAVRYCKHTRALLVVARMDRLARNVRFLSQLMDSGIEFVACDNPNANRLTIHLLSCVAEHEARTTAERTKAALRQAKLRGVRLGSSRVGHWNGREHLRAKALEKARESSEQVRKAAAKEFAEFLEPHILKARESGCTYSQIATILNEQGLRTRRGKLWSTSNVWRLCATIEAASTSNPAG